MQLNDQQKKTACIAIACLFLLSAFVAATQLRPTKAKPAEPPPVPLGTNELKVGAKLIDPKFPYRYEWTVKAIDRAYDFPDGELRPAVQVYGENGTIWIPREKLENLMVVQ